MPIGVPPLPSGPALSPTERGGPVTLLPEPDPEQLWCPILSVDDHALEPLTLFQGRVPRSMADKVPFVTRDEEGVPYWNIEGRREPITVSNGSAGRPQSEWTHAPAKFEEFREGVHDAAARLRDMSLCGIYAALNFPSMVFGFAGRVFSDMADPQAGLACVRAWNLWMLEEWCGVDRNAFVPSQLVWLRDVDIAASDVRRNAELGFRAISFSENPDALGLPSIHTGYWDPLFRACEETGTVVNLHVGSSSRVTRPSSDSPREVVLALFSVNSILAAVDWVFSKIPVRFPELRIVLSEGGASWVPMVAERLRRAYRQLDAPGVWTAADGDPVEILLRNFWFASLEDPAAFRLLDTIGEGHLMVECDYPHTDSTWPGIQGLVRSETEYLSASTIRAVCYENAAGLYRHPLPPEALIARSQVGGRTISERETAPSRIAPR
jgi:predicted TIM-barrel fold metal-dependent hydrolase